MSVRQAAHIFTSLQDFPGYEAIDVKIHLKVISSKVLIEYLPWYNSIGNNVSTVEEKLDVISTLILTNALDPIKTMYCLFDIIDKMLHHYYCENFFYYKKYRKNETN